ncbi:MAG: oligosaccharide flippase family protein [Paludibacteraceae bacterium]|nr:oligosaccharide flippase family protein [Paludibacteraceae bacterium]
MKNQRKLGVILNYVSITLNMLIGLTYTPFLIRCLGQSEYGIYSLAASVIAYLTVLDLGFGNAIVRYTAKFRAEGREEEKNQMFGMFIVLYTVIGIVALGAGAFLTYNVENLFASNMTPIEVSRTQMALGLMTLNLAVTFPFSIWGSIMTAYEQFVFKRLFTIARNILNPLAMILLLTMGYKAIALVVVTTIFNFLTLFSDFLFCKIKLKVKPVFGHYNWSFLKEVSIYSVWVFLNAIIDRIYWSTGQFVLGIVSGTAAVAVYAVAVQLHTFYMMFSTAVSSVFLPKVTAMASVKGNEKNISDLFVKTGRMQFIIISFALSGFILFGRHFIVFWAGKGYEDAYIIALLFFLPLTVPLIQTLGMTILQARNQMKFRSLLYIAIALGSFVFSIPAAKEWGGLGCAIVTSLAIFLGHALVMNIYYGKKQSIDIVLFWKEILKMSIVPLLLTLFAFFLLKYMNINLGDLRIFIASVIIYGLIYSICFWLFSLNSTEKKLFSNVFLKFKF